MHKYLITVLIFLASSVVSASSEDDRMCWVEYKYEGKTDSPRGHGSKLLTTHAEFLYRKCKLQCYEFLPEDENFVEVESCTLGGIPIEESPYKDIYLTYKDQICHVKVKGKYAHKLYLAETEAQCKAWMDEFVWCRKGAECEYT